MRYVLIAIIVLLFVIPATSVDVIFHHSGLGNYTFDDQAKVGASVRKATDIIHLMGMSELIDSVGYTKDGTQYTITTTGTSFKGYVDYTNNGYAVVMTRKSSSLTKGEFSDIVSTFHLTSEPATVVSQPTPTQSLPEEPVAPVVLNKIPTTDPIYPLKNGEIVVYGVTREGDKVNVDMSAPHSPLNPNDDCLVELIDSENQVHETFDAGDHNFGRGGPRYNGSIRSTLKFSVPNDVILKQLKVTPDNSDPTYIDLTNIPMPSIPTTPISINLTNVTVSSNGVVLKLYNAQRTIQEYGVNGIGLSNAGEYTWMFDMALTNMRKTSITFAPSDFAIEDSTNWIYPGDRSLESYRKITIGSNQSQRFQFKVKDVGEFSKPILIGTDSAILGGTDLKIVWP